jgi:hypothetical protein
MDDVAEGKDDVAEMRDDVARSTDSDSGCRDDSTVEILP